MTYNDKEIDEWNVNDFMKYFGDRHQDKFGIEYLPMGTWASERGIVGNAIGTKKKRGQYDKRLFKRFLDACIDEYKPSKQYHGTSIGFSVAYRKNTLQRIMVEQQQEVKVESEQQAEVSSDITDWFSS